MAQSTYTQYYSNFIGTDMSSDPRVVARNRLAYSVNMWRDYESEQGAAIETFPGFRMLERLSEPIIGMWSFRKSSGEDFLIIHADEQLYMMQITEKNDDNVCVLIENPAHEKLTDQNGEPFAMRLSLSDTSFVANNSLYIISENVFVRVYEYHNEESAEYKIIGEYISVFGDDRGKAWIPTTYYNGQPYEQRNAFSSKVIQIDTAGGVIDSYKGPNENDKIQERVDIPLYEPFDYSDGEITVTVNGTEFKKDKVEEGYITSGTYRMASTIYFGDEKRNTHTLYFDKADIYQYATWQTVKIEYTVYNTYFNPIGNLVYFQNDKLKMAAAICGCTKSAVYDGRVFLTGNPELPNTVFYSQRNLTGVNDPTYFGVYNYFNDGDGNTPNVDLLSLPSMLMVMKPDTVQDGSIYYHVGADNPHSDKSVRNLMPRIYPATKGAAGLGSAGSLDGGSTSCNFLDDPVLLTRRGLDSVGKESVNLERTLVHRSSNVDRLLRREDLAHASIAEWKGYLVICCNGHLYLADSRTMAQHPDGSYQYEWFYLEGVGTYKSYAEIFTYCATYPVINVDGKPVSLGDFTYGKYLLEGQIQTHPYNKDEFWFNPVSRNEVIADTATYNKKSIDIYYTTSEGMDPGVEYKYLVESTGKFEGDGKFYGAKHVLAIGDLLLFATDYDICVFNTDKRGEPVKDENGDIIHYVDDDKIDASWYTFNGVPYKSACALRLDDCDKKSLTKTTIYGTTVARLKMIPGSKCKIKSSVNGRDWIDVAEAYNTRQDFDDIRFDNLSFTENEDNVVVIPEVSRGWMQKQYYFESTGFAEPFGLYELSYIYKIAGKLRYV